MEPLTDLTGPDGNGLVHRGTDGVLACVRALEAPDAVRAGLLKQVTPVTASPNPAYRTRPRPAARWKDADDRKLWTQTLPSHRI